VSVASLAEIGIGGLSQVEYALDIQKEGAEGWQIRQLELCEGVSELYTCVLDLAHDRVSADVTALEEASCVVSIARGTQVRRLCGVITRVEWRGTKVDEMLVRVHVEPALAVLAHSQDCRIFQNKSIKEVLAEVLTDPLGVYDRTVRFDLDRQYQPREYCTQYNESHLDFALRLVSEEGIFLFFDHAGETEALVLTDANEKCPVCE
jgi:type VI secretion system secreted protein VgrG